MSITKTYYDLTFNTIQGFEYSLVRVKKNMLVGENANRNIVLLIESREPKRDSISQRTQELSFECNANVCYSEGEETKAGIFHVITCYSNKARDKEVFLKLCDSLFMSETISIDYILETLSSVAKLFKKRPLLNRETLQGLYAELYTIYVFKDVFHFNKYWQEIDMMKYDFSISSSLKLEVKSTLSDNRVHHFLHDQVASSLYNVYVLSYKLRTDNNGLSLFNLINKCIPLLENYPKKQIRLLDFVTNEDMEEELHELKFCEEYTRANMRFIEAKEIPRFQEESPDSVSKAQYDSNCENCSYIDSSTIISIFNNEINKSHE